MTAGAAATVFLSPIPVRGGLLAMTAGAAATVFLSPIPVRGGPLATTSSVRLHLELFNHRLEQLELLGSSSSALRVPSRGVGVILRAGGGHQVWVVVVRLRASSRTIRVSRLIVLCVSLRVLGVCS